VGHVDEVLRCDSGNEVLVAAGEPDHLVREHGADDDRAVRLHDVPVNVDVCPHRQAALRQLGDALAADVADVDQHGGIGPLVVHHHQARIGRRQARRLAGGADAEVAVDLVRLHVRMCAGSDDGGEGGDSAGKLAVQQPHHVRQRAGPGVVRHDENDVLPVDIDRSDRFGTKRVEVLIADALIRAPDQRA
jgi:hypothetical protein